MTHVSLQKLALSLSVDQVRDTPLQQKICQSLQSYTYTTEPNEFRVSGLGACARKLFWEKIAEDKAEAYTESQLGTFRIGHIIHEYLQNVLPKEFLLRKEQTVTFDYKDIRLIGHYDALLYEKEIGLLVCDFKTTKNGSLFFKQKSGPGAMYLIQANAYASILNVETCSILFIGKDDLSMLEFRFKTNADLFYQSCQRIQRIYEYIQARQLPPFDGENWECAWGKPPNVGFCAYSHQGLLCGKQHTATDIQNLPDAQHLNLPEQIDEEKFMEYTEYAKHKNT